MDKIALKTPGLGGTPIEIVPPPNIPTDLTIGILAKGFINVALVIGIILSLAYLTYGGIFWLQSKGTKETLDKARRIILYSILGLIVMSLALVIVNVIAAALGSATYFTH